MIFAFDEISGPGDSFPEFRDRKQELIDELLADAESVGDRSHVSGAADYIVRITTAKWTFQSIPANNAFVIVDNVDNLALFERIDNSELESVTVLSVDDDWFDAICASFKEFRERIDE